MVSSLSWELSDFFASISWAASAAARTLIKWRLLVKARLLLVRHETGNVVLKALCEEFPELEKFDMLFGEEKIGEETKCCRAKLPFEQISRAACRSLSFIKNNS